jgi:hypothetical protein
MERPPNKPYRKDFLHYEICLKSPGKRQVICLRRSKMFKDKKNGTRILLGLYGTDVLESGFAEILWNVM